MTRDLFARKESGSIQLVEDRKVARVAQLPQFAAFEGPASAGRSVRLVVSPGEGFRLME